MSKQRENSWKTEWLKVACKIAPSNSPRRDFLHFPKLKRESDPVSLAVVQLIQRKGLLKDQRGWFFRNFERGLSCVWGRRAGRGEFSARDRDLLPAVDTTEGSCQDGCDCN